MEESQNIYENRKKIWENGFDIVDVLEDEGNFDELEKKTYDEEIILNNKYNIEANKFLVKHAKKMKKKLLDLAQFLLSATYAYLLKLGWNVKEFYSFSKESPLGVDIAILRQYIPATHGSKSNVMTFAEKYTWCAKNEILGYLADQLLFRNTERNFSMLDDYGLLDDFPNPAQELNQENPDELMKKTQWFMPENLTSLGIVNANEEMIKEWIKSESMPDFEKWIDIEECHCNVLPKDNKWISLYSFNSISNDLGGESLMWFSTGIIKCSDFNYLKNDLKNGREFLIRELDNPEEFNSSTEARCYISPKDICWMNWKTEMYNELNNITIESGEFVEYKINKAVEECVANYPEYGDVYYKLPSHIIRDMLNIIDGDGYKYYDKYNQLKAVYFRAGERWEDSQSYLCVSKQDLFEKLKRSNIKIFWIVRVLKQATSKTLEKYSELHMSNDRTWLVWFEDGDLQKYLFTK